MTIVAGIDSSHQGLDPRRLYRYRNMKMNTGVNMGSTMKTEAKLIMGSTVTETMGSTMEDNNLTIIRGQIEGRDLEAQAEIDIIEETVAQDKKEAEEEKDLREDTAPMKETKGDTLVRDEDTAQGP